MEPQCEIKFTTTRSDTDLNAGKTCYQGQLRHNTVLTQKETRKAFAAISKAEFAHTDCTLEGPLERGDYWIVAQSRYQDEANLIRCRRRIKVV